ncbi:hypothetical protein PCASD_13715 [Puccinia coronata f. sp. avenae]|uniref:Protein kinase domain-containing protein n=1 Tax=Puccinia coronata f. sp. avenae TaxID=200324 RepID=A0A2N5UFA1_9BASI|nr:hypothetical protein PCASD_13715 [Puccinia coronata f. sp. avenae]
MTQSHIPTNDRFDVIKFEDLSMESTWVKLGEGSFGKVYKAQYLGLPIAIKEIIPRTDYDVEKYFARECKIIREARHPNIVQYIGLCLAPPPMDTNPNDFSDDQSEDEFLYGKKKPRVNLRKARVLIISEFVPKGNLRSYLNSRSTMTNPQPLTWRLRVSFAIDIARAVAYLHERKCLHRDLKLDNCLLTENFRVKLCDFGLARFEARNPEEVRQLSFCGTDGYMSPEILRGLPFDLSTDVYSLGIIFCELISMKRAGACASSSICDESAFLQRAPPRYSIKSSDINSLLETQDVGCPTSFIELSLRCTQVDAQLRPTLKEILSALDSIEEVIIREERQKLLDGDDGAQSEKGTIPSVGSMKFVKSNIKLIGKQSFKRIPSFHGQIIISKAAATVSSVATPDLVLEKETLQDSELRNSHSMIDLGIGSFPIDPRLLPLINLKRSTAFSSNFFGSTLKMPTGGVVSPRKGFPSAFLKPVETQQNFTTVEETSACSSPSLSDVDGLALSYVSEVMPSQLGTIPTITSTRNSSSSTSESFEEAMQELEKAYKIAQALIDDSGTPSTPRMEEDQLLNSPKASSLTIFPSTIKFHSTFNSESRPLLESDLDDKSKSSDVVPHRFTIVKFHWLAKLLNLNHKDSSSKDPKIPKLCGACRKPIGSKKAFLQCDDCGENCHQKCSNSTELSDCQRQSSL